MSFRANTHTYFFFHFFSPFFQFQTNLLWIRWYIGWRRGKPSICPVKNVRSKEGVPLFIWISHSGAGGMGLYLKSLIHGCTFTYPEMFSINLIHHFWWISFPCFNPIGLLLCITALERPVSYWNHSSSCCCFFSRMQQSWDASMSPLLVSM